MRIWSIHPKYLDTKGLVALWRETLLAQKVLQGKTKGYVNHPQLLRFKTQNAPLKFIGSYLEHVYFEALKRGYEFDKTKILKKWPLKTKVKIKVTKDQKEYEFEHLKNKLKARSPGNYLKIKDIKKVDLHPLFKQVLGKIEEWEIV